MILSNNKQEPLAIRQAAAAHLKLVIQRNWVAKDKVLSDQDKDQVKQNLHQALIYSLEESKITKIYTAIIEKIATYDFPHRWEGVQSALLQKIQNPANTSEFYGSLLMFKCIVKNFSAYLGEDRKDIDPIIDQFLPAIANALKLSISQQSQDALNVVLVILKTVFYSIRYGSPNYFDSKENIAFWMQAFKQIFEAPLEAQLLESTSDEDEI